jgi:hypothetical protein
MATILTLDEIKQALPPYEDLLASSSVGFRAVSSNEATVAPVQHLCYEKVNFDVEGRVLLYVYMMYMNE